MPENLKKGRLVKLMDIIRLFIIEDQPSILKNLVKLLSNFNDIAVVGTAMSGEEAIETVKGLDYPPHVVLCDLGLPNMNGIETTKKIKAFNRKIEVLIFTVFEDENKVLKAIQAGASGYLLKGAEFNKIREAITDVFYGGTVIQPTLARKLLKYFSMPLEGTPIEMLEQEYGRKIKNIQTSLTVRELECLQIIAKGLSNHEAAMVLKLSKATIRTHLEHIYQKLDVSNRVEAITEGIRQGIIDL
jgi:DNA-binding NarL/FixJ family response regulator